MSVNLNSHPGQGHKKVWQAPKLNQIAVRETESGPAAPNLESILCRPS